MRPRRPETRAAGRRLRRGQALVEFAIALPIFLLIFLAIVEGAAFAFNYANIQHAAQEGGRLAALASTNDEDEVKERVVARAVPVKVDPDTVTVEVNAGDKQFADRAYGDRVSVSLVHDYRPVAVLVFGGVAAVPLSAQTEFTVE
jgi:Flp pilus assembly protein TadG